MEKSRTESDHFWSKRGQFFPFRRPLNVSIYQDVITDALRHEYGGKRNAAKELARRLLKSPHTVRNWLRGTSTPRGEELLRLMVECKPLREKINQFIEENQQCSGE